VWSEYLSTKQVPANTNYREHFSTWVTKQRHLQVPRLSEQEIVKHVAKHYSGYFRTILISLPDCTILAAMKIKIINITTTIKTTTIGVIEVHKIIGATGHNNTTTISHGTTGGKTTTNNRHSKHNHHNSPVTQHNK